MKPVAMSPPRLLVAQSLGRAGGNGPGRYRDSLLLGCALAALSAGLCYAPSAAEAQVILGPGNVAAGANTTAIGSTNSAVGNDATALGSNNKALAPFATAVGNFNTASGVGSAALGSN